MNDPGNGRDALRVLEDAVDTLRRKGVHLWVEDGALRYRAKKGVVTSNDIACLLRSKGEICSLLAGWGTARKLEPRLLPRPHPTRSQLAFSQLAHWNARASREYRPIRQIVSATRIQGRLQAGALKEALSEVVRRHEALRTRIVVSGATPIQELLEHNRSGLQSYDLCAVPPTEQNSLIRQYVASAILDVNDYAADPLFSSVLLKLSDEESVLILALDHIVSDGASLAILQAEILALYAQLMEGRPLFLPPVGMQCIDYSIWQTTRLVSALKNQMAEWSGLRRTMFPTEHHITRQKGWSAVRFALGERSKAGLEQWARNRGTSLTMVVLGVYVALVLRWCESFECVVQVMTDGRTSHLLERSIAYLAFPLYVGVLVGRRDTILDLLEITTRQYCRALERPDFFYSYVQNPDAEFTRNTSFNWLPRRGSSGAERLAVGDEYLTFRQLQIENPYWNGVNRDAEPGIVFEEAADGILCELHYPQARFSYPNMSRFVNNFELFVNAFLEMPTSRIFDIAMV